MATLNATFYAPKGFAFNPFQVTVLPFVIPIPLAVIGFTLLTAVRALQRMDAVAIVERGALSLEERQTRPAAHVRAVSLTHPLAATTFYRRHKGQAAVLIGATALMIAGTSLFVFGLESFDDARQPLLNHLRQVSVVTANGLPLEPATIAQVRAHPAVERVVPAMLFSPLGIFVPPIAPTYPVEAYGVTAEDMAYLVELYGLRLGEGRLPRPNSNEIVIPWTVAQNRGLRVGDVIGNRDHPVHPDAPNWAGVAVFKRAYAIFRERGYRARLLAAAYRHRLHWTELVGGDVSMTLPHAWQVRFNASGIVPEPRMDEPVDPALIDDLYARIPDFRRAYEPDGMTPAEFESYGASARTLRTFVKSYHDLQAAIRDLVLPDPDVRAG
jgi:hypothetical protein